MVLSLLVATLLTAQTNFRPMEAIFPVPGIAFVRLTASGGEKRWMLLDTGSAESIVRGVGEDEELGFEYAPGVRLNFRKRAVSQGESLPAWEKIAADGILGIDNLSYAALLIDYKNRTVKIRIGATPPEEKVVTTFLRETGRPAGPILSLPLKRDPRNGWLRTPLRISNGKPADFVVDTGANLLFMPSGAPGLGSSIIRGDVTTGTGRRPHSLHLATLSVPGNSRLLPALVAQDAKRDHPLVAGAFALSSDWILIDTAAGQVHLPVPTPAGFADGVADFLAIGGRRATRAQRRILSDVSTPRSLARARALVSSLVAEER